MKSSVRNSFAAFILAAAFTLVTPRSSESGFLTSLYYNYSGFSVYNSWFMSSYSIFLQPWFMPSPYMLMQTTDTTEESVFKKGPFFNKKDISRGKTNDNTFGTSGYEDPEGYRTEIRMDSISGNFRRSESIDSIDISFPYEMSLDEYLKQRKNKLRSNIWDSLLTSYDLKKSLSGGDIARLIGQATGISIPIPPNPLSNIFGKPEISINVNGEVNLRMGFRWDSQNLGTVSAFGQSQATPIFNQDIRVNVSGRIGDKLKLGTDWNTRRTFDYDNTFKIGYEGYDDDIIRLVEVGNVTLPLESQLIDGGQALFGVRTDFQFGPLYLKTLFSQRRGEKKFVDVHGGVSKQPFQLRAYDYAKNHFFLDTVYKYVYREYFKHSTPILPNQVTLPDGSTINAQSLSIKEIEVWETTNDVRDVHSSEAIAIDTLPGYLKDNLLAQTATYKNYNIVTGRIERGRFERLDTNRYRIDRNLGHLTIYNLRPDRTYAVSYRIENTNTASKDDDIYVGTPSYTAKTKDTLVLKLVYVPNMQPGFKVLWNRNMKNIYSINATNVDVKDTKIGVWYINQSNDSTDVLEGAPDKLVTILRVDQVNNSTGAAPGDGQFDLQPPFFDARYGEITFPDPEPFRDGLKEYFDSLGNPDLAEQYIYPDVYDTTYDVARLNANRDRFIIAGEVSGRSTNRISLGAFNLAPNSVKVSLDGRPLREYEDYIVDYYAGTLTLRNQQAMLPGANLKIEYEQHDVFNITTRTLAGIRGDYILARNRKMDAILGFTAMHYDQSAIIDRVRLGEEPVSNTMLGFDAKLQWETPWITKALDALPFYDTKAKSSLNLGGELAMILPVPNKRNSTVRSDNGQPVVYIDDFEGAQKNITLGLNPTTWTHASQPEDSSIAFTDSLRAKYRGNIFWYQYFIPRVPIKEVYPKRSTLTGRSNLSPLEIIFSPEIRGIYNNNEQFLDSLNPKFDPNNAFAENLSNREKIWGGMMRLFSSFNTNFDTENIEYIEIMMRLNNFEPGKTRMFIDLGQISEDLIPNGVLNTEDGSTAANPQPNNIIDVGEDKGIDEWNNIEENEYYPAPLNEEKDPARDDYAFNFAKDDQQRVSSDFRFYNNYEGNSRVSELGQFPDTEILNKNNGQTISTANDYFTYEININPDPKTNKQIVGGGNANWYLYRIPVRKPTATVGAPLFSNIQYIRIWFKGGRINAQIADWRLVGSQWQRISQFQSGVSPNDSVLQLAFVNREENSGAPDYYTLPPGVYPPRQLNNPNQYEDILLNEQSLSVSVNNLRFGEERMAVRIFQPLDLFNYKELKFFFHGDGSMPDRVISGSTPKAYAFLRFGTDSSNYYEYRVPLLRGWQDLGVKLSELTAIKQLRDSSMIFERFEHHVDEFTTYVIKGNPILTRVQFFGIGISNPNERFPNNLTTTMWVNELRLIKPEDDPDWAGVGNFNVKLADLGTISGNFKYQLPNFHRLDERFGDRITSTNWTVSMQGNLEKFAPKSFRGMKIPISYTHSEFFQNPEYVANNDINLEKAATAIEQAYKEDSTKTDQEARSAADAFRKRSQTLRIQDNWALTGVQLGLPTDFFLIDQTLNKITFSYSYAQEYERSPVVEQRFFWLWRLEAKYSTNIPKYLEFEPLTWTEGWPILGAYNELKLNLLPQNISFGLNMQRSRTTEKSRFLDFPSPVIRDFSAMRTGQFTWKISEGGLLNPIIDYNVSSNSTLVPYEFDETGRQRTGSEIARAIFFQNGKLMEFGKNNLHTQHVAINFKPIFPAIFGINEYMDMTCSYTSDYTWRNPLQPDPNLHDIAKIAGYSANFRYNIGFKLKALGDDWFGTKSTPFGPNLGSADSVEQTSSGGGLLGAIGRVFKTIFLDFDDIKISLNQNSTSNNPGVFGGTGMNNFWARGLTGRESKPIYGPSFAYQMGWVTSPHGGFDITGSDKFPYFGFKTYDGLRPPNAVLQENYNEITTLQIQTNRPLWEGATLDLNWQTSLGYNKNQTVNTDADGNPTYSNIIAMESFQKTFLAFPTIFGIDLFGSTIENVISLYNQKAAVIEANSTDSLEKYQALQNALGESFHDGLQAFTIFGGKAGKFLPAVNWALKWEGIENWGFWKGLATRIFIEHAYSSQYQENAQITDNGRSIQGQQIQFGFQPVIAITTSWDEEKLDGLLTATIRWNSTTSYQLMSSNKSTISKQASEEISLQASYTLSSFEFPLLGFTFKNDFEVSLLTSYKSNKRATYDIVDPASYENNSDGRTLDGNTQLVIEPRASYSMSERVRASLYYRYEGTFTEGAAQPGFATHQVGLDIRISISGGR